MDGLLQARLDEFERQRAAFMERHDNLASVRFERGSVAFGLGEL